MIVNGIDVSALLGHNVQEVQYPEEVPGRVAHVDADFLAYQCSYERADEPKPLEDMMHNVDVALDHLRRMAAASTAVLHLTPNGSTKGGRYEFAIQKEYQGNRQDKEKPRYLHVIREFMHRDRGAIMHMDCEADDGMSSAQYEAIANGRENLCIICTKDKDLSMVPGLHLDWDTGEIVNADTFGRIWLDDSGSATKLKGFGQKFFWAQMLMGDTADNVQGLPLLHSKVLNKISPTATIEKANATLADPLAKPAAIEKARKALAERKHGKCGAATTFKLLDRINDHKTAFAVVKRLYEECSTIHPFKHWHTGEAVKWQDVFKSEAMLLWMRRKKNNDSDVFDWMRETCLN